MSLLYNSILVNEDNLSMSLLYKLNSILVNEDDLYMSLLYKLNPILVCEDDFSIYEFTL